MKIYQLLILRQQMNESLKRQQEIYEKHNRPERLNEKTLLKKWQIPEERCFHDYPENTDDYRYLSKRGCRCKRDAIV